MGRDRLGKKLAFAVAAMAAILLVLRVVGGGDSQEAGGDDIDRMDTGRSGGESGPVETSLDRVETDDEDDAEAEGEEATEADEEGDDVVVEATRGRGRFESLDLFDYVAIAGAAFEAAREEYRNRI